MNEDRSYNPGTEVFPGKNSDENHGNKNLSAKKVKLTKTHRFHHLKNARTLFWFFSPLFTAFFFQQFLVNNKDW